jgi:L-idonate 5-dehydrogenase
MKALVIHAEKDLRIEERDVETPGAGEIAVKIARGGICGSDLHYYNHGGFGTVRIREPMILGHEVSGFVEALGEGVEGFEIGDLLAVSPSRPDWNDEYAREGMPHHSLGMQFYGSAMPFPHIQGAFREHLVARAEQCVKANGLTPAEAAMAEPLSVVLHSVRRAGEVLGKRVLVTGCGPIGCLAILALRRAGAAEIVATDIANASLAHARTCGVDQTINTTEDPGALTAYEAEKGYFHVLMECSGAAPALLGALPTLRPQGILVQLGLGGDMQIPMNFIVAREVEIRGSFRFHFEFPKAVELMQKRLIDVRPLITGEFPLANAVPAFEMAGDRNQAMKVQLAFNE